MCKPTQAIMSSINVPSIYIPRVHNSVTWQEMKSVFEEILGEDSIKRVDIKPIKAREGDKPPPFNRAYVHVKKWNPDNEHVRDKLLAGGSFEVEYDPPNPYYWLCVLNKHQKEQPKAKPRIVLRDEDSSEHTLADHMPEKFKGTPSKAAVEAMMRASETEVGVSWQDYEGDGEEGSVS
jgi:hypothetical protein